MASRYCSIALASNGRLGSHPFGLADRKSTRLNSSHVEISYAVFCLKKKKTHHHSNIRTLEHTQPPHTLHPAPSLQTPPSSSRTNRAPPLVTKSGQTAPSDICFCTDH